MSHCCTQLAAPHTPLPARPLQSAQELLKLQLAQMLPGFEEDEEVDEEEVRDTFQASAAYVACPLLHAPPHMGCRVGFRG